MRGGGLLKNEETRQNPCAYRVMKYAHPACAKGEKSARFRADLSLLVLCYGYAISLAMQLTRAACGALSTQSGIGQWKQLALYRQRFPTVFPATGFV